jgi:hypothetical protein
LGLVRVGLGSFDRFGPLDQRRMGGLDKFLWGDPWGRKSYNLIGCNGWVGLSFFCSSLKPFFQLTFRK